jgi:hypothetical protein
MSDRISGGDVLPADRAELATRAKQSERCKKWRNENPEKARANWDAWNEANVERRRAIRARAAAKWRANNPEKEKARRKAYRERNREKISEQGRAYREKNREKIAQQQSTYRRLKSETAALALAPRDAFRRSLAANDVWSVANKSVPCSLPTDVRDDVISSLCLAVYAGEITADDIPSKARAHISAHYRGRDWWQAVSLDAPIFRDGCTSLLDVLEGATP